MSDSGERSPGTVDRPLEIAFVMPGVGVVDRGAEAFVLEIARALEDPEIAGRPFRGFRVTIFCRDPRPFGDAPFRVEPLRTVPRDHRLVEGIYRSNRWVRKVLDTLWLDPLHVEWTTAALSALGRLGRGGYDLLVMEGGLYGAMTARLLRRFGGLPFVDIAHGNSPKWEGAFARQRPDRVVAFTEDTAAVIRERAPRARVEVIPHGVDLELFRPDGPAVELDLPHPRILAAGAVDGNKRFDLTVRAVTAMAAVDDTEKSPSLIVLGDGPRAAELDRLAADLLGPGRYLRRAVRRAEMPAWYRAVDLFTMPSRLESFGLTYLEALACGVPVVATDDAVRREVIGGAGLLVDPADIEAYAAALATALAWSSDDWTELPRERAARFPFATTARAYADLFARVVAETKGEPS